MTDCCDSRSTPRPPATHRSAGHAPSSGQTRAFSEDAEGNRGVGDGQHRLPSDQRGTELPLTNASDSCGIKFRDRPENLPCDHPACFVDHDLKRHNAHDLSIESPSGVLRPSLLQEFWWGGALPRIQTAGGGSVVFLNLGIGGRLWRELEVDARPSNSVGIQTARGGDRDGQDTEDGDSHWR